MGNLLIQQLIKDNHAFNEQLIDCECQLPPEPEMDTPVNYKTKDGYKAVLQDYSSYDLILLFENGHISDMCEVPF